ncbi:uncharacterized protein LOC118673048 [Myotis myotis]|uniref:uncharacterized protein LOC118673048 n=1 Tax=Myotis myotis TaxID=51298 RepID=UPI00174C2966|nr:uncharacterized protein LOC118673048 [Myotis myotis]
MESGDPLVEGDRELLMDSQETPTNMGRLVMGIPHSQDLAEVEEGDLVTVSPVAVKGIPEAHKDTQGPVMARLTDSQETPTNMGRQVMGIPHSQDLAEVEEGDLVTVSPVAVKGIPEAHRDTQGPVMARLTDSQETPTNMGRQVMGIPHSQDLAEVEEGDLVTVSPVAVKGIPEAHKDTQGPVMARLTDSQETPTNMGRQVMGIPHSQDLAEVEEGDLVAVSPVAVNGILEAHRDTQGPVMARLTDSQDTPTNMGRQQEDKIIDQVKDGDTVAMEVQDMTMGNLGMDLQGVVEQAVTILALLGQGTELKTSKCQFTVILNLVQLLGRDPIIIVKCVQKIGGNRLINNQDLGTDSQTSIQLIYMDPVNSISEIHLLKIR